MPERRALVLEVFPKGKDPYGTPVYFYGGELGYRETDVDWFSRAKWLTDPELAAEYWCAFEDYTGALANIQGLDLDCPERKAARAAITRTCSLMNTVERFATHDHYDEQEAA